MNIDLKNTKIVDEFGKPLIVYRSQKNNRIQSIDRSSNMKGIYFSANKESTKIYGNITKEYYLNIKNPLILKDKEWNLSLLPEWVYKKMISDGYDGAVWLRNGEMYEIIAFYEKQIIPIKEMKFTSIREWLNEQKEEPTYGCIMMDATKLSDWEERHLAGIDPKDVYIKPYDESFGLENNPHVTILYGIHEDEIDPEVIMETIEKDMDEVTVTITNISIFEVGEYDVVKYEVPVTEQLLKYRKLFEDNFPNTQTFPEYKPHVTIAYVKPGEGKKYVSKLDEPFEVTFNKGVYSWHEDGETIKREYVFKKPEDIVNLDKV